MKQRPPVIRISFFLTMVVMFMGSSLKAANAAKLMKTPWEDVPWSSHMSMVAQPQSPAKAFNHFARLQSSAAVGKSSWATDVHMELTETGQFAALMGSDLAWKPAAGLPSSVTVGAWIAAGLMTQGPGLGLNASVDTLVPVSVTASKGASLVWTVRLSRWHAGVPVLMDSVTVSVDEAGRVRRISAKLSAIQGIAQGDELVGKSLALEGPVGLITSGDAGGIAQMVVVRPNADHVLYISLRTGEVVHEESVAGSAAFDVLVTSRHMGPTPVANECVESNVAQCADIGQKAWRIGTNGTQLCCGQSASCAPSEASNCTDPGYTAHVKAGVVAADLMRSVLMGYGFTDYNQPPTGTFPADLVVAPYSAQNGNIPCSNVSGAACTALAGLTCKGAVDFGLCAIAFRPRNGFTGSSVQCGTALANTRGAVLMSDEAQQAVDVMTHEFGHLWLSGYGLPPSDSSLLAGQPMSLHEAVSDGLGLLVDQDDWLVGEQTICARYRSACAPSCKTTAQIASFTTDPGCVEGPNPSGSGIAPNCAVGQPRLWQDFELKPVGGLGSGPHHNTGIANFLWFLTGSTSQHLVGGGPGPGGLGVVGQGRGVLAVLLRRWVDQWATGSTPTFDGLREGLLQIAQNLGEPVLSNVRMAVDAAGLWRTDSRSSLFGVGRVASFIHSDGAGGNIAYAVNWDGVRRFEVSRCQVSTGACLMATAMRVEDPAWVDADYPLGPAATVDVGPDETWLLYVANGGLLVRQRVLQGAFQPPEQTNLFAAGTLIEGLAVGAVHNPQWGQGWAGVALAYVCQAPGCTCGGLVPANGRRLCVSNAAATWFSSPADLQPQVKVCAGAQQPITPPQLLPDAVGVFHEPALSLLNGQPVLTWVDRSVTDNAMRVHYSVAHQSGGAWLWSPAAHWTTKGELQNRDIAAKTDRPVAAAVMRGAGGGWSSFAEDNQDRLYIMYSPVTNPDPACAAASRMLAFASARLSDNTTDLADFSMGVPQNASSTSMLAGADIWSVSYLRDHHAAGGFMQAQGRTFAWVRLPPLATEPLNPDYALGPVDGYGPLLIKSTGWR